MGKTIRRRALCVTSAVLLLASFGAAQQKGVTPSAPLPSQVLSAKKIFVSNLLEILRPTAISETTALIGLTTNFMPDSRTGDTRTSLRSDQRRLGV